MRWFIPSVNGDFRFEPGSKADTTDLVVADPTPFEREALKKFGKVAVKRRWVEKDYSVADHPRTSLDVPLHEAAAVMAKGMKHNGAGVITAFAYAGGKLSVTEVLEPDRLAEVAKTATTKGATAAATVSRPSLCCPECPGRGTREEKACEVLWEFLTPPQRAEWLKHRGVTVVGGTTGHTYFVSARDTERARRVGRCVVDLDDRAVLYNFLWEVPPAEEVLVDVILLRTRENWLRVPGEVDAGYRMARRVLNNPLAAAYAMPSFQQD